MFTKHLLLLLFGLGLASVHAADSVVALPKLLASQGYDTIALRRTADNRLYVSGRLENKRASFLVDSGWSLTTVAHAGPPGNVTLSEIKLGRTIFANQPAEQDRVTMGGQRASFDVVLGLDFLRRHSAVIDCGANRLFTRSSATSAEAAAATALALQRAGFVAVDLVHDQLVLTCPASFAGNSFSMLVDSGAAWTCLDWPHAEQWGLAARPSTTQLSGEGNTGKRGLAVAALDGLRLGAVGIPRTMVGLVQLKDWGLAQPGTPLAEVKGLLGGDLLARHEAVIDCGALKLWLKPKK